MVVLIAGPALRGDPLDTMRKTWFDSITGGHDYDATDPQIHQIVQQTGAKAAASWEQLKKARPFTDRCFADIPLPGDGHSRHITECFARLETMSRAYWGKGGELYGNVLLRDDIIEACDWLGAHHYNASTEPYSNWWDWEIGVPRALTAITTMLYDFLTPEQRTRFMEAVRHFTPDFETTGGGMGANGAWAGMIIAVRAILQKDATALEFARDGLESLIKMSSQGDGFYPDGSYVGHLYFAYTGAYGLYALDAIADAFTLLGPETPFPMSASKRRLARAWIEDGFWPLVFQGRTPYFSIGREIGRSTHSDRSTTMARAMLKIAGSDAMPIRRIAKSIYLAGRQKPPQDLGELVRLKMLMADTETEPLPSLETTTIFSVMDKAVVLRRNWALGISYHSTRIHNFEDGGENRRGWHQSDGMTSLILKDTEPFDGNFWPTVDSHRLPGTTVTRGAEPKSNQPNRDAFAGGVTLERFHAAIGFVLKPDESLTARKAWFVFDDEVACVGSGISGSGDIETVIENRKLKPGEGNLLTIDGSSQSGSMPEKKSRRPRWLHIEGVTPDAGTGYFFPVPTGLDVLRESRTDAWSSLRNGSSANPVTEAYLTVTTFHGKAPGGATYAYVLLPYRTATEVEAYSENPEITILENSDDLCAVRERSSSVTGVIFWGDHPASIPLPEGKLKSDTKAAVLVRQKEGRLKIAVADPTQSNTGSIEIEFTPIGPMDLETQDSEVSVLQTHPSIRLQIDVKGARGKSFTAQFREKE